MATSNAGEDVDERDHAYTAGGNVNGTATLRNSLEDFYETKHVATTYLGNCALGHLFQKNKNLCSHKNLYTNVHNSIICNS